MKQILITFIFISLFNVVLAQDNYNPSDKFEEVCLLYNSNITTSNANNSFYNQNSYKKDNFLNLRKTRLFGNSENCCDKFHRISLRIGGGPYYHYGIIDFPKLISYNLLSFQGEAMIGLNFKTDHWPIHTAAIFARKGITNMFIDQIIKRDQELPEYDFDRYENFNDFEEYEAGLLIGRWFRFSAGLGHQIFYDTNGRKLMFDYYTFTSGFCFGTRNVRWSINVTGAGGNDYQNIHFRFYSGLNLYLNLLKI